MLKHALPMALALSLAILSPASRAQLAETPEDAQQFLISLLQAKVIGFHIGNDVSNATYGLQAIVNGSGMRYKKSMLGGWKELASNSASYHIWPEYSGFDNLDRAGEPDICVTAVHGIKIVKAGGYPGPDFDFAEDPSLTREAVYPNSEASGMFLADTKWIWTLSADPRTVFAGPYFIDWRQTRFNRRSVNDRDVKDRTYFLLQQPADSRGLYAQFSVTGSALADHVENAIRVLQLSCAQ